jgi:hypothetical protein
MAALSAAMSVSAACVMKGAVNPAANTIAVKTKAIFLMMRLLLL